MITNDQQLDHALDQWQANMTTQEKRNALYGFALRLRCAEQDAIKTNDHGSIIHLLNHASTQAVRSLAILQTQAEQLEKNIESQS